MARTIEEFRDDLINTIKTDAEQDKSIYCEDEFINYCKDILSEDRGLLTDLTLDYNECTPSSSKKYKKSHIDAFSLELNVNTLNLVYADFNAGDAQPINNEFIKQKVTLRLNFVWNVFLGYFNESAESDEVTQLAKDILTHKDEINKINVIILSTNKKSERIKDIFDFDDFVISDDKAFKVDVSLLDIDAIYKCRASSYEKEDIIIHTKDFKIEGIPCVIANVGDVDYDSYLAIVPGSFLSDIYLKWGSRLLESNVRSFLSSRGKINKGILNTILNDKAHFFAYNNGIATIADSIETKRTAEGLRITGFTNLQIINGGQTTASLASAVLKTKADLFGIYVQMKLSVVERNNVNRQELISNIARYANKQNKVTDADLNSNHPFYQLMEDFSRRIKAPLLPNRSYQTSWFFERARGQYDQMKMRCATKKERETFERQNPKSQKFTKADRAKYINADLERPFDVAHGAEVNWASFQTDIQKKWESNKNVFNEAYFKDLIAKAILFKHIGVLVSNAPWYIETTGYRAQIVAYTFSKFIYEIRKQEKEFDYGLVWSKQSIPQVFDPELRRIAKRVFDLLYDTQRPIANIGEYAKRKVCWDNLNKLKFDLLPETISNLMDKGNRKEEMVRARKDQAFSNGISSEIKIFQNGVPYWEEVIRIGKQLGVLTLKELFMCNTAIKYCKQEGIKVLRRDEIRVLEGIRKKREQYIS